MRTGPQHRRKPCYPKKPQQQRLVDTCEGHLADFSMSAKELEWQGKSILDVSQMQRHITLERVNPTPAAAAKAAAKAVAPSSAIIPCCPSTNTMSSNAGGDSSRNLEAVKIEKADNEDTRPWLQTHTTQKGLHPATSLLTARGLGHLVPRHTQLSGTRPARAASRIAPLAWTQSPKGRGSQKARGATRGQNNAQQGMTQSIQRAPLYQLPDTSGPAWPSAEMYQS